MKSLARPYYLQIQEGNNLGCLRYNLCDRECDQNVINLVLWMQKYLKHYETEYFWIEKIPA